MIIKNLKQSILATIISLIFISPAATAFDGTNGFKLDENVKLKWSTLGGTSEWTKRTFVEYEHRNVWDADGDMKYAHDEMGIGQKTKSGNTTYGLVYRNSRVDTIIDKTFVIHNPYAYITPSVSFLNKKVKVANRSKIEGLFPEVGDNRARYKNKTYLSYNFNLLDDNWSFIPYVADEITLDMTNNWKFTNNRLEGGLKVVAYKHFSVKSFYEYNWDLLHGGKRGSVVGTAIGVSF